MRPRALLLFLASAYALPGCEEIPPPHNPHLHYREVRKGWVAGAPRRGLGGSQPQHKKKG